MGDSSPGIPHCRWRIFPFFVAKYGAGNLGAVCTSFPQLSHPMQQPNSPSRRGAGRARVEGQDPVLEASSTLSPSLHPFFLSCPATRAEKVEEGPSRDRHKSGKQRGLRADSWNCSEGMSSVANRIRHGETPSEARTARSAGVARGQDYRNPGARLGSLEGQVVQPG